MLYYDFYGYEEFKARFGLEKKREWYSDKEKQDIAGPSEKSCTTKSIARNMVTIHCCMYIIWQTYRRKRLKPF